MKLILEIAVDEPKLQAWVNSLYDTWEEIPSALQVVREWGEQVQAEVDAGDMPDMIWLDKKNGLTMTHRVEP